MPATHVVSVALDAAVYIVNKDGEEKRAHILHKTNGECYVHYLGTDKRMDEWVPDETCTKINEISRKTQTTGRKRKRRRRTESPSPGPESSSSRRVSTRSSSAVPQDLDSLEREQAEEVIMTEEEFDIEHHKQITAKRNFDDVFYGDWKLKTWYYSPYPLTETELDDVTSSSALARSYKIPKIPGVPRTTSRSHGRTVDLLVGGLNRQHGMETSNLWVCDMCFKYMSDGLTYEIHKKSCESKGPPGRTVYERGAHKIWEVDGAQQKLYCQNLSLFGKLFIDVKTLYFDCDNFLFYVLTDADSKKDHMMGFFSKEKHSFDDYNLACIMVLPQYQKKNYGMLLIEFSYELSRRAGKVGTPERPLSDLGLRSYLSYWVSTLLRFFRRVLATCSQAEPLTINTEGNFLDLTRFDLAEIIASSSKKKEPKPLTPLDLLDDSIFTTEKGFQTTFNLDGSALTHVAIRCTLGDIARATNLRIDDAGFALNEIGFLMKRLSETSDRDVVVITREMVNKVTEERKTKRMCLNLSCILI